MNKILHLTFLNSTLEFESDILLPCYHSILLMDRNECDTVARGEVCAYVSLRASLSLRFCFNSNQQIYSVALITFF